MSELPEQVGHRFRKMLGVEDANDGLATDETYAHLYDAIRTFLRNRGARFADELASETILRLLTAAKSGTDIQDLWRYAYGVACNVWKEHQREEYKQAQLSSLGETGARLHAIDPEVLDCLRKCRKQCLSAGEHRLLNAYYEPTRDGVIVHRRRLAERLGISSNALMIRVHKLRRKLGACVEKSLQTGPTLQDSSLQQAVREKRG